MDKIDFLHCAEFLEIKKMMGISDDTKAKFTIEVPIDKVVFTSDRATYNGQCVIIYIRDQPQYFKNQTSEYKFHLIDCQTLRRMKNNNQYGKYVVSTETNGIFLVNKIFNGKIIEIEEKLSVCKHCLQKLNWKGYRSATTRQKEFIYQNFSIEEFFAFNNDDNRFNFSDIPRQTDKDAPLNVYPPNWNEISRNMKEKYHYTCQECHKDFSYSQIKSQLIEVHHKNGLKFDCRESNLEVLCQSCHQNKHNHKIHKD